MAKTRKTLTTQERLERLREQEQKTYRMILKSALDDNEAFASVNDAYRKQKRYLNEAESLITDEGYDKQVARLEARIARIREQQAELDSKRTVASESVDSLRATIEQHEAAQAVIGQALVKALDGGEVPTDEDALNSIVESVLSEVDTDALSVVNDPFADFRAANRQAETNDEDENETEE